MENEQDDAGRDGQPNLSCETKLSGANGDREILFFLCSADHEQNWQPYPVDPFSATSDYYAYIHTYTYIYILHTCAMIVDY